MSTRVATFFESVARTLAVALILALVATAGLWYALQRGTQREITAYFPSTVGLYSKNTVDVQGVPVGTVEEIVPQGQVVRVTLKVDNDVPIAADAKAVIVAPTLVSDRYVQLGPSYTGGPMMPDGATIPIERTGVPVELDRVYKSLDSLATSLGPNGANQRGALNQLLNSSAGALGGNGEALKSTITEVAGAVGTLSDNRDNLFATVDNLGQFTNTLARNDGQVRLFNNQLADISGFLASERGNLSQVLQVLPPALEDVARFVRDNRDILRTDVRQLANITDILVRQRAALTELTDVAPLALGNLTNTYNASSGTLDVRPVLAPTSALGDGLDPRALLCGLLNSGTIPGVPQLPAVPAGTVLPPELTNVARAQVVCGQLLDPTSVTTAIAPIQNVLDNAGLANALPALPGTATGAQAQPGTGTAAGGGQATTTDDQPPGATQAPAEEPAAPGDGLLGLNQTFGGS